MGQTLSGADKSIASWIRAKATIKSSHDVSAIVQGLYRTILRREADPEGLTHFSDKMSRGEINEHQLMDILISSREFRQHIQYSSLQTALHASREFFVQSLPSAKTIVDLGGSSQGNRAGALVILGYPYKFNKLTIIDLPINERHALYANCETIDQVETEKGPVFYEYRSMTNLSCFDNQSVDLVYSGQTIEHVTEEEGDSVCHQVMRVLKPSGFFCIDTPNGAVTRLQQDEFIDPDHKVEYHHQVLRQKLVDTGFIIKEEKGLGLMQEAYDLGRFDEQEISKNPGMFSEIEKCYLLAYVCQKPTL